MNKTIGVTGAAMGLLAVVLGAFGAHGLEALVDADALKSFETGVKYQMYHALLLLFTAGISFLSTARKKTIFILVLAGVILFSGSIYGLATNTLSAFDFRSIAFITPVGGILLMVAWGLLCGSFIKAKLPNR